MYNVALVRKWGFFQKMFTIHKYVERNICIVRPTTVNISIKVLLNAKYFNFDFKSLKKYRKI